MDDICYNVCSLYILKTGRYEESDQSERKSTTHYREISPLV